MERVRTDLVVILQPGIVPFISIKLCKAKIVDYNGAVSIISHG